jgi:hypothetical protein
MILPHILRHERCVNPLTPLPLLQSPDMKEESPMDESVREAFR